MLFLVLAYLVCCQADRVPLFSNKPAISGRDVVAYQQGLPLESPSVSGEPIYAYNFSGFQFWFRSDRNKEIFVADPWRFIPAYGGYGAYGTCCGEPGVPGVTWGPENMGPTSGVDGGWTVYRGRLYLNQYAQYGDGFKRFIDNNIKHADNNWIKWWGSLRAGPMNTICWGGHDKHDVEENFCRFPSNDHHDQPINYGTFAAKMKEYQDQGLLDPNYFQEPQVDCNYVAPPEHSPFHLTDGVSAPNPCLEVPTTQGPAGPTTDNNAQILKLGLIVIGGCCILGAVIGVAFIFWKKKKEYRLVSQQEKSGLANLSEEEDLSLGDQSDSSVSESL